MKKSPFRIGFKFKVNMGIMSIVFITALMIAISASHIVSSAMNTEYKNRGVALCLNLAMRSVDAILARDMLRSSRLIQEVAHSADDILYAFIQDENGRLLVHTFPDGFPKDLTRINTPAPGDGCKVALLSSQNDLIYDFATPVMAGEFQVGTVRLGLLKTKVTRTINGLLWMIMGVTLISMFVAGHGGLCPGRRCDPQGKSFAQSIGRGDPGKPGRSNRSRYGERMLGDSAMSKNGLPRNGAMGVEMLANHG